MSEKGFIKLHRGWRDTDGLGLSAVYSDCEAWLWLLENAAWKDRTRFNAKGEEIHIERGQLHVSLASLSTAWGWSKKRVRTFLDRIERVSKVGTAKAQSGTIITICNYDKYQGDGHSQGTEKGTVGAQSGHTHKEEKEIKEEKKTEYAFSGRVIRLTPATFAQWEKSFPDLDLTAQLESRDAYLAEQEEPIRKKWFMTTAAVLGNRQQAASQAKRPQSAVFDGPC